MRTEMAVIQEPLTNLQLELLQLYSLNVPEKDLLVIKDLIANHFAEQASNEFDKLWDQNGWTNDTMDQWLAD